MKKLLLGNQAIALGAITAGVKVVAGYPGTPSTEVLETIANNNEDKQIYVEWSTNEKAGLEVAAGASYAGARSMVTMKQVGLNVASDPLMSLVYVGTKGGMVILVADDPGPISSQTEQDTRHFGKFGNVPVLDPSSPEEAYEMTQYAFELSEQLGLPVIMRPTTKISHASGTVEVSEKRYQYEVEGFKKDSRWVIFPSLSYRRHIEIEEQQKNICDIYKASGKDYDHIEGNNKKGIACGGVTYSIVKDIVNTFKLDVTLLKVGFAFPPYKTMYNEFLNSVEEVLVLEELDPVIEENLFHEIALNKQNVKIKGKLDGFVNCAGELKFDYLKDVIGKYLGVTLETQSTKPLDKLPIRPPVLCAGCPHRASFYAVKKAMKGKKSVFCGDIGCYTLGNAKPLDMADTCLCMGAGVTISQGIKHAEPDTNAFAFIGDSTFFASGMTGVANAVYNKNDVNIIILDNSTTAMTGHQPHPGIGKTMMNEMSSKISIEKVVKALNVEYIAKVNPFELDKAVEAVNGATQHKGVSVVIFEAPCVALYKPEKQCTIEDCIGCMRCINEIGCPAMYKEDGKVKINETLCYGCGLCKQVCPTHKIKD